MPLQPCIASGNIVVCRFVVPDATGDFLVKQAAADELATGISQMGARANTLMDTTDPPLAAAAGEPLEVLQEGHVEYGGTIAAGDYLKVTTGGKAIAAAMTSGIPDAGEKVVAQALEAGSSGTKGLVKMHRFVR